MTSKIMFVDPGEDHQEGLYKELSDSEYTLHSYDSSDKAMEALRNERYDAIMYGEGMVEGREFLSEIRDIYEELPFFMAIAEDSEPVSGRFNGEVLEGLSDISEGEYGSNANHLLVGVENSPVGVTVAKSKDEEGDRPLIYANNAFEEMTGYSRSEIIGGDCRRLQGEDTDPEKIKEIRSKLESHEPVETTILNYTKSGEKFWNRLRVAPIMDGNDEAEFYIGYQMDVTDEVNYRQNLETILSIVSHDFKNDLTVIKGNLDLLEPEKDDTDGRIDVIERRVNSMFDSLENIGTAKNELMNPIREELALNEKIESIVEDYVSEAELNDFEFDHEKPDEDFLVEGSAFLDQYFGNMIENSLEHSNGERISIGYEDNGEEVTVVVEDDGRGIEIDEDNWGTGMFLINQIAEQSDIELEIDGEDGMIYRSTFELK